MGGLMLGRWRLRARVLRGARGVFLFGAALLFVVPVGFLLVGSLKGDEQVMADAGTWRALVPDRVSLQNYKDVFHRVPMARYLVNSLVINVSLVSLGLMVNSAAGYALARMRFRGRKFVLVFLVLTLSVPFEGIAVPLFYQLSALGWRDDYAVQIAPFVASPLSIYLFYRFFLDFPRELEEAARMDGAGSVRTFVQVVVPNAKPVFATVAIVSFLFSWGQYLWPLLMTTHEEVRPLPLAIATFYALPPLAWGDILAFGVMMVLPVLVVFLLFQGWFAQSVAATGLKG